ncbi:MAG: hypothetical protein Q8N47_09130 [Bryobacterales bacterium]|nr:hypothetical protein [Bryobacterales bacterium]
MTEIHAHVVTTALLRKGFVKVEASHHTMFWLVAAGRRRGIRTRLSHGQRKVDDSLLSDIARELHLSKRDLLRFIQCEISHDDYVELLIGRGQLRS